MGASRRTRTRALPGRPSTTASTARSACDGSRTSTGGAVRTEAEHINVDDDGLRVTTPISSEPSALKIFMFGGSTLWGTGVRDGFTIPSLVARDLQRNGVLATVTNFGETGYVSTQERIALERELIRGRRPDLVIFYDGINDTYTAFQQRVAGLPQNEYNRVREFNLLTSNRRPDLVQNALRDVLRGLSIKRFLDQLRPMLGAGPGARSSVSEAVPLGSSAPDEALARQILQIYAGNLEIAKTLGRHYDFDLLPYWQPTVLDKPQLTPYESACRTEMAPMEPLYRRTYDLVRKGHFEKTYGLRDVSLVFAETRIPVFVDFFHLDETGNEMVAKIIVADVLKQIAQRQALRAGTPATAALP